MRSARKIRRVILQEVLLQAADRCVGDRDPTRSAKTTFVLDGVAARGAIRLVHRVVERVIALTVFFHSG